MPMIPIDEFLLKNKIEFKNQRSKLNWFKRLRAKTLYRIGETYFIDDGEADRLLVEAFAKKDKQRKFKSLQARKNFGWEIPGNYGEKSSSSKGRKKPLPKREEIS